MNSIQRKLPASVLMCIGLIGCLGLNTAAADSSIQLPVYVDATNTDRLQSVLNARGWDAQFDASGSLIVQYPQQRIPASHKQLSSGFEQFANALADRGWSVKRDDGGNLILRPNQSVAETSGHSHIAPNRSLQATVDSFSHQQSSAMLPQFSQRLESAGWQTDLTRNGDLIIHLPGRQSAVHTSETNQAFQAPVQTSMDRLANRLKNTGWMTHRDENGGVIFSHPSLHTTLDPTNQATSFKAKTSVPTLHNKAPGSVQAIVKSNDFSAFRKAAENRGWWLSREVDGDLFLIPFG